MLPGRAAQAAEHWQHRWEQRLATSRRLGHREAGLNGGGWVPAIVADVRASARPVAIVAHGCGVQAAVMAAQELGADSPLKGLFLVAPAGSRSILEADDLDHALAHPPLAPLPVPAVLVASRNDPQCPFLEAEEWAYAWGAAFTDAGDAGHIDVAAGYGPWPEGLMRFAGFLARL
jgi:predicted alpha/beta hydrolase family esterase